MANVFLEVSTYTVLAYAGPGGLRATISLVIPNASAFLLFYPDNVAIPNNSVATDASGRKAYSANFSYYQYAGVIDLLRNEKPIKFFFNDVNLGSYITAADEPVGEEE